MEGGIAMYVFGSLHEGGFSGGKEVPGGKGNGGALVRGDDVLILGEVGVEVGEEVFEERVGDAGEEVVAGILEAPEEFRGEDLT